MSRSNLVLPEFFEAVSSMTQLDAVDWQLACSFAERWKLSVADALLDLRFIDETTLAKALAKAHNITYLGGSEIKGDFSELDFESFQDLLNVGAVPLEGDRLAICNPYDDLRGILGPRLCQREWVVTERRALFDVLRRQSFVEWLGGAEE